MRVTLQVTPARAGALAQRPDRTGERAGLHPAFHRGEPAWRASSPSVTAISMVAMGAPNSTAGHDNGCGPRRWPLIDQAAIQPAASGLLAGLPPGTIVVRLTGQP